MKKSALIAVVSIASLAVVILSVFLAVLFLRSSEDPTPNPTPDHTHTHEFGEWELTVEPTCEAPGTREKSCTCGALESEAVPAVGHTWGEWSHEKLSTCVDKGIDIRTCAQCQKVESTNIDTTPHNFKTLTSQVVDGAPYLVVACDACGTLSDERYAYEPEQNQEESLLFDCAQDFCFDVRCSYDENYIAQNLTVFNAYLEACGDPELAQHPFNVEATADSSVWRIRPKTEYAENTNYIVRLNGELSFVDHYGDHLSFKTIGPNKDTIEFNDDLIFLKKLETIAPGYYPYEISFDDAEAVYYLTLSKRGSLDNTMIGEILCVGDCTNADELKAVFHNVILGRIRDIYEENSKTIVVLESPPLSEVFAALDVSGSGMMDFVELPSEDAIARQMAINMISSNSFVSMLNTVQVASQNYASSRGYEIVPLKYSSIEDVMDDMDVKITEKKVVGKQAIVAIEVTYNPQIPLKKGSTDLGSVNIKATFTIKCTINLDVDSNIDDWLQGVDDYIANKIKELFEPDDEKIVGKDRLLTFDATVTNTMDMGFNLDVVVDMDYSHESENYFMVHPNTQTLHRYDCRMVAEYADNFAYRHTYSEIQADKNLYKTECKLCKPLTRTDAGFVIVNNETVHQLDCSHMKTVTTGSQTFCSLYPIGNYSPCMTCIPNPDQVSSSFNDYLNNSLSSSDWGKQLIDLKDMFSEIVKKEEKLVERDYSDPTVRLSAFYIFEVLVDLDFKFDFKLEATVDFDVEYRRTDIYKLTLKRNENGYYLDPERVTDKNPEKTWAIPNIVLDAQGKIELTAGPNVGIKIGLGGGLSQWFYFALEAEVGLYADLSGVFHLENATADRPRPENYYAAYLEIGVYWDLRAVYNLVVKKDEISIFDKDKDRAKFFSAGDHYAYFSYTDYDQELYITDQTEYKLPSDMLEANCFDLLEMESIDPVELNFSGKENHYDVEYLFFDEKGYKISYCSVNKGVLTISDKAPDNFTVEMVVQVYDATTPDTIGEFISQAFTDNNGAYYLDSLHVTIHYSSDKTAESEPVETEPDSEPSTEEPTETETESTTSEPDDPDKPASEGLAFVSIGDGTCYVSGIGTCTDTNLVIPKTHNGEIVISIGDSAFTGITSLSTVLIPEGIISIGNKAFYNCDNLVSVTIGNGVTDIEGYAFSSCDKLSILAIGNGLKSIGGYAFSHCKLLNNVTLPDGVTEIGSMAFGVCSNLATINIPKSVTTIGIMAFAECTSLTSFVIPENVTRIESSVFSECSNLSVIHIPEGVEYIGMGAFWNCTSLKEITVPNSVTNIEFWAFKGCTSLNSIILPFVGERRNGNYSFRYIFDDVSVPESLKSVVITDDPVIHNRAFADCDGLTSITIPKFTKSIGHAAFSGCSSITQIFIPNSVASIDSWAFGDCSSLIDIYYAGTEEEWCSIPKGNDWDYNTGPYTIHYNYTDDDQNSPASEGLEFTSNYDGTCYVSGIGTCADTDVAIPNVSPLGDKVTGISDKAFDSCTSLTGITIPDSVTSIGDRAFMGSSLKSIVIPDSVMSIGDEAFKGCSSLTSIVIPDSVTSIGGCLFMDCFGLTYITVAEENPVYHSADNCLIETANKTLIAGCQTSTIPTDGSVTRIGYAAFAGCSGLTSIDIPASVTTIGEAAFIECIGLTSIIIPNNVTCIDIFTFYGCSALTSVVIPDSVMTISDYAFFWCPSLTTITFKGTIAQWTAIDKSGWHGNIPATEVICSDGTVSLK